MRWRIFGVVRAGFVRVCCTILDLREILDRVDIDSILGLVGGVWYPVTGSISVGSMEEVWKKGGHGAGCYK